jgi:hypothetical protein
MARITARQAFTRARARRIKSRTEQHKALMNQRNIFAQQLQAHEQSDAKTTRRSRRAMDEKSKKITDYFVTTNKLCLGVKKMHTNSKQIEVITIDCDANNNQDEGIENDPHNVNSSSEFSDVSDNKSNIEVSHLGASLEDLGIEVKVEEDVEIVEILPPIPLRDHPVHEID